MKSYGSSPSLGCISFELLEGVRHRLVVPDRVGNPTVVVLACGYSTPETGADYHFRLAARQARPCHDHDAASKEVG
jgi:hypothetical protein